MKKMIYASLVLLFTSVIFMACAKQENDELSNTSSVKVEGIIAFNTNTKKSYVKETNDMVSVEKAKESFNEDYDIHSIMSSFKCDKNMPTFATEKELKSYLLKNKTKTNGVFEFFVDNELVYSVQIKNGEKWNEKIIETTAKMNLTAKEYPCSYAGIRACAIDGIHNQNWYQMAVCITEGFGCVAEWYLICTIDNC